VPLLGAPGFETRTNQRAALARASGLHISRIDHLLGRYGGMVDEVLTLLTDRPELAEPLVPGLPYLRAEAIYAVRHEMARTLDDVLSRRTRARLLARDASAEAAASVAELIAPDLGWSHAERDGEVRAYRAAIEAERAQLT
jgi:glycerol-3-phosphate dehydrogenase